MNRLPIRVLCVDDHAFLVAGLQARMELEPDMECIGHLPSAEGLVREAVRLGANIVLLDIEMPGPDPFEALEDLHKQAPNIRSIILSAYVRDHYIDAAVRSGAWGYLSKSDEPDAIIHAIREVTRSRFCFGPEVAERLPEARRGTNRTTRPAPISKLATLTPREQQILRMIGKGLTRSSIAKEIHRSPKTVDAHRMSIMEKLDIHDRVKLARYALREGIAEL